MITLEQVQDQCAMLRAEGKTPQTILLSCDDADKLGDPEFLYGLRCVRANNYPESKVVQGFYEVVKHKNKSRILNIEDEEENTLCLRSRLKT